MSEESPQPPPKPSNVRRLLRLETGPLRHTARALLTEARRHAQQAADTAVAAGALLALREDSARYHPLDMALHDWALRSTAQLTALMGRLREAEEGQL